MSAAIEVNFVSLKPTRLLLYGVQWLSSLRRHLRCIVCKTRDFLDLKINRMKIIFTQLTEPYSLANRKYGLTVFTLQLHLLLIIIKVFKKRARAHAHTHTTHTHTHTHTRALARTHSCTHVRTHTRTHARTHAHTHTHRHLYTRAVSGEFGARNHTYLPK